MTKLLRALGSVCVIAATSGTVAAQTAAESPTYNKDVAVILNENCVMCHRPGEIAPMSLLSYKDVRPWARAIRTKVVAREMPPWFAERSEEHAVKNLRALTAAQIEMIVKWVEAGAPEGTGTAPAAPPLAGDGQKAIGRPADLVVEMPTEIELPASGQIPNFSLWSKSGLTSDTFVEAVELRPSNRAVTHHAGLSATASLPGPPGTTIGKGPAWKGGPMVDDGVLLLPDGRPIFVLNDVEGSGGQSEGAVVDTTGQTPPPLKRAPSDGKRRPRGATSGSILGAYGPGGGFFQYPEGIGKRIGAGDYFAWGIHYTNTGRPERDRHSLLIWKPKSPITHEAVSTLIDDVEIVKGKELLGPDNIADFESFDVNKGWKVVRPRIPPNDGQFTITSMTAFDSPVTLLTTWPHMHFRGKSMKYMVVYPDGREETILNVPRYNFEWQLFYAWEKPIHLPAGSVVKVETAYDNSVTNKLNPSPGTEVIWDLMSWNEMHFPFVEFTVDAAVKPWEQPDYRKRK